MLCFYLLPQYSNTGSSGNYHLTLLGFSLCLRKPTIQVPPGPTQTGLYSHRRWLEAGNFGFRKYIEELYYPCSENKGADQLRVFAYADFWFSHAVAHLQKEVTVIMVPSQAIAGTLGLKFSEPLLESMVAYSDSVQETGGRGPGFDTFLHR